MSEVQAVREAFGETLVTLGQEDERIVVLDADLATSTKVVYFNHAFPDRFFQMGVAEQNMVGVAAGMALVGKIPFVSTFGSFASKRATDQVSMLLGYARTNVKLVGAYSGIVSGNNGATHQAIEDVAIMRAIPNMVVVDPADDVETTQAVRAVAYHEGPVYLRITRDAWPRVSPAGYRFRIGKACVVRDGADVTLIGSGMMVSQCAIAAEQLVSDGISARILNMSTIKPIDREAIITAARETGAIVTAENHSILGGLGSAVAEVVVEHHPVPMLRIGLCDTSGECGSNQLLLEKYRMGPTAIASAAHIVLRRKAGEKVDACLWRAAE
ncbi:MAG: transketolase family protein [Chloroflexota bacterium]|nr:transketolase family protein [Chloroflexota bacterium]